MLSLSRVLRYNGGQQRDALLVPPPAPPLSREEPVLFMDRTDRRPYRVAVPLANPANVRPLITLACGLAGHHGGEISAFCVLKDRLQSEFGGERSPMAQAQQRLAIAVEAAHRWEVPVHTEIRAHRDVAEAILEETRTLEADLLVMGWRGGLQRRMGFSSQALDRVIEQAHCDVAILKPAPRAGVFRKVLIADLHGENAVLATRIGAAVAERFSGETHRLELAKPAADAAASPGSISVVQAQGGAGGVRPREMIADSTPEGILGAARGFDLVVVGTDRRGLSRQLLYGDCLESMARRSNASILVVRARR
jgi:CIC family chloride channel protein